MKFGEYIAFHKEIRGYGAPAMVTRESFSKLVFTKESRGSNEQ
jgi:hypothetical protein